MDLKTDARKNGNARTAWAQPHADNIQAFLALLPVPPPSLSTPLQLPHVSGFRSAMARIFRPKSANVTNQGTFLPRGLADPCTSASHTSAQLSTHLTVPTLQALLEAALFSSCWGGGQGGRSLEPQRAASHIPALPLGSGMAP